MTTADTKPCPFCGEEIKAVAIKCKHCGERLDRVPGTDDTVPATDGPAAAAVYGLPPGTKLGSFVLGDVIGEGGMGSVHCAEHRRLGSKVAIKVLAPTLARDPALLARFEQEARLQANLKHPNVVAVHDFITEGEVAAFVMELVEGRTLQELIEDEEGPMPLGRCLELFWPVLDALAHAHDQGIVHRDVKPSNIIVSKVAGRQVVKVADFGIAKALGGKRHTTTGAKMGTLYYMSPEQCRGDRDIDHRADIYALGVTLFEMATGQVPFEGGSEWEMMCAHIEDPPPAPRSLCKEVPEDLEAVILKALAKEASDRYQSALEMRDALAEVAEAEGIAVTDRPLRQTSTDPDVKPPTAGAAGTRATAPTVRERPVATSPRPMAPWVMIVGGLLGLSAAALGVVWALDLLGAPDELAGAAPSDAGHASRQGAPSPSPDAGRPAPPEGSERLQPLEATASSFHRSRGKAGSDVYAPSRAVDGYSDTWWQEGQPDDGVGEHLKVSWGSPRVVREIRLVPGYTKFRDDRWGDRWNLNNRISKMRVTLSSGRTFEHALDDRRGWHSVPLEPAERAEWLEVTILAVHPGRGPEGERIHDSGISEIEVWASPLSPAE